MTFPTTSWEYCYFFKSKQSSRLRKRPWPILVPFLYPFHEVWKWEIGLKLVKVMDSILFWYFLGSTEVRENGYGMGWMKISVGMHLFKVNIKKFDKHLVLLHVAKVSSWQLRASLCLQDSVNIATLLILM